MVLLKKNEAALYVMTWKGVCQKKKAVFNMHNIISFCFLKAYIFKKIHTPIM